MNWSAISVAILAGITIIWASSWRDAVVHGDPPSAARKARNATLTYAFLSAAAFVALRWGW